MVVADFVAANGTEGAGGRTSDHSGFVVLYGEAVRSCIEVDAESAVVGGIRSGIRLRNLVITNR